MKRIELTNSPFYAVVDDEDYERTTIYEWRLSSKGYVVRCGSTEFETVTLHNFIMNVLPSGGVDHLNRNKLDNYKQNLRIVSNSVQGQNRGKFKNNTSGFKGVSFHRGKDKWCASIKIDYKQLHLGNFDTKEEAAIAYDKAALKYFGPQASTNFIQGEH